MFSCKKIHYYELVDTDALATFNAERIRGLQHSKSYTERMARESEFFTEMQIRVAEAYRRRNEYV
jgi:hypothetical protein